MVLFDVKESRGEKYHFICCKLNVADLLLGFFWVNNEKIPLIFLFFILFLMLCLLFIANRLETYVYLLLIR